MNVEPGRCRPISAEGRSAVDAYQLALDCMLKALEYLDGDPAIPSIVGSQLQLAIDRLSPPMLEGLPIIEQGYGSARNAAAR